MMKPCFVKLKFLPKELDPTTPKKSPPIERLTCVYCDSAFNDRKCLWEHMRKTHPDALRCTHKNCASYFRSDAERRQHIERVHMGDGKRQCVYCSHWTTSKNLRAHTENLHRDVAIGCNVKPNCCTFFLNTEDRNEHIKKVHFGEKIKTELSCIYCRNKYASPAALGRHVQNLHQDEAIKCSFNKCAKYFKAQLDLEKHFKQVHDQKSKRKLIQCPKCKYQTREKYHLRGHFDLKHGSESLKCPQCTSSAVYKSDYALRLHTKRVHAEKRKCPFCKVALMKITSHLRSEFCSNCAKKLPCAGLMRSHRLRCKPTARIVLPAPVCQ
jgi:hypothetical protein